MLVSQWIDEHPEYHAALSDVDTALRELAGDISPHRAIHLAVDRQRPVAFSAELRGRVLGVLYAHTERHSGRSVAQAAVVGDRVAREWR